MRWCIGAPPRRSRFGTVRASTRNVLLTRRLLPELVAELGKRARFGRAAPPLTLLPGAEGHVEEDAHAIGAVLPVGA